MKRLSPPRRSLAIGLLLALTLARTSAAQLPDRAAIARNWRVYQQADTGILLADVRPDKLFYFTGEPVNGVARLVNPGAEALTVELRAWLEQGLDRQTGNQAKSVTVPPGELIKAVFTWPPEAVARYGQALRVDVLQAGQVVARGGDCFTSHDSVWAVGIAGNHPVGFTAEHVKDMAGIERAVEGFRDKYTNTFEKFFWAPDDFANMTPEKEQWFSGQARYHERLDRLKHMCEHGRRIGVLPTTYGKSIGSGSGARDVIRERPELVHGFGGVMDFSPTPRNWPGGISTPSPTGSPSAGRCTT